MAVKMSGFWQWFVSWICCKYNYFFFKKCIEKTLIHEAVVGVVVVEFELPFFFSPPLRS